MKEELQAIYDSRKSFYKKAYVESSAEGAELYSYDTYVANVTFNEEGQKVYKVLGFYSSTTLRHIKEFLMQEGFPSMSKAEIEKFEGKTLAEIEEVL